MAENRAIRFGIIRIGIDAVQYPEQLELVAADDGVKPVRIIRILDFLRIMRADR